MLELLNIFKTISSRYGDKPFIKVYKPFAGLYLSLDNENNINRVMDYNAKTKKDLYETKDFEWFRERDFYSMWINSNKALHSKKMVQSNNCYSLILKRKNLSDVNSKYFENLKNHYIKMNELIDSDSDVEECGEYYDRWIKLTDTLLSFVNENNVSDNTTLKIFYEVDIDRVRQMSTYYFKDNRIFLDKTKVVNDNKSKYGIPNFSSSFDGKKTFLKPNYIKYPSLIDVDDAMLLEKVKKILPFRKFYLSDMIDEMGLDILENNSDIFLDIKSDNGTPMLNDMEIINNKSRLIDYVSYDIVDNEIYALTEKVDIKTVRDNFSKLYCNDQLKMLCFVDNDSLKKSKKINPSLRKLFSTYRPEITNYFYKNYNNNYEKPIVRIIDTQICNEIMENGITNKLRKMIYTKYSFINIFDRGSEMKEYNELLKEKVLLENQKIDCDDELCFVIGQAVYYLSYQSKAKQKTGKLYQPYININQITKLKSRLIKTYEKYCHSLNINPKSRINKALTLIMNYTHKQEKINKDMFLLGLTSKNLLFEDKKNRGNKHAV